MKEEYKFEIGDKVKFDFVEYYEEILCRHCGDSETRTRIIPSEGKIEARKYQMVHRLDDIPATSEEVEIDEKGNKIIKPYMTAPKIQGAEPTYKIKNKWYTEEELKRV